MTPYPNRRSDCRRHQSTRPFSKLFFAILLALLWTFVARPAAAEPPRVLPQGQQPRDARLGDLKDLNGYFPFEVSHTPEAWAKRAEALRRQLHIALGLWPMPTKTPANAVVHGKVDRDEYTVERVYLESYPGHFVTGSLYRPKGATGRRPAVMCPHGHWANGRFYDAGEAALRGQLVQGAERFDPAGRFPIQARCAQLARMGCIVFQYDMLGYADSQQIEHRPGFRDAMNTRENWGYFSVQAELRLQNMMGLQSYNSIRALDWLCELPDVDPDRIAVTGASGGGTQTFILAALDPRPAVAFPAVMVSTAMQGGCTCENAPYLRIGTGNVEIAALFAPKPLGMTAANDWTKEIATKGLPELERHFAMLGAADNVKATPLVHFPHNYNYVSRAVMYSWLNQHLKLGFQDPIVEEDFVPLTVAEMTVWDTSHPKPPSGDDYERQLLREITVDARQQIDALTPRDATSLAGYREVVGGAIDTLMGRHVPKAGSIEYGKVDEFDRGDYLEFPALLRNTAEGEELPTVFLYPHDWNGQVVIWLDAPGKAALYGADGKPKPAVRRILASGASVVGVDLLDQGEFLADGQPKTKARIVESGRGNWVGYAGYTFGYNYPLFVKRVHDVLSVVSFCRNYDLHPAERVDLVGFGEAGLWVAAARAQAGELVDRAVIGTGGFRFETLSAIDDPRFVPGIVKYGDLPGMLALSAPHPLWLAGEGSNAPELVDAAYRAAGSSGNLMVYQGAAVGTERAAVDWLLK